MANKGGGGTHKILGPRFPQQTTVPLDDEQYVYLAKMKRIRGGSLAEEVRRCIAHCIRTDALQPHPELEPPDYVTWARERLRAGR